MAVTNQNNAMVSLHSVRRWLAYRSSAENFYTSEKSLRVDTKISTHFEGESMQLSADCCACVQAVWSTRASVATRKNDVYKLLLQPFFANAFSHLREEMIIPYGLLTKCGIAHGNKRRNVMVRVLWKRSWRRCQLTEICWGERSRSRHRKTRLFCPLSFGIETRHNKKACDGMNF